MKYTHDCDKCEYLGTLLNGLDFWIHTYNDPGDLHYSVIVRFGNENHEYMSVHASNDELIQVSRDIGGLTEIETKKILVLRKLGNLIALNYIEKSQ